MLCVLLQQTVRDILGSEKKKRVPIYIIISGKKPGLMIAFRSEAPPPPNSVTSTNSTRDRRSIQY